MADNRGEDDSIPTETSQPLKVESDGELMPFLRVARGTDTIRATQLAGMS